MKHLMTPLILAITLLLSPMTALAQESEATAPATEEASEAVESPLSAVLVAQRVELTEGEDGAMVETLVEAATAAPGDVLQYTGTYTNMSDTPMVGLIVNGPVPSGTGYVGGSQSASVDAVFEVLIEGEEWQELPAYKTITDENGAEQRVEANPSDYQQVRWRLNEALAPEASAQTSYRVAVDN
jgi:uncharacterized repeat protein (TIGR01451 family)